MTHRVLNLKLLLVLVSICVSPLASAQEVPDASTKVRPLPISSVIPDVTVRDMEGNTIKLREFTAQQPTVLVFYRGGWCPYCSLHLAELKRIEQQIIDLGWQIAAISVDQPEVLKQTLTEKELPYTLLSDSPAEVLKAFGLAYTVDPATVARYKEVGIDLEASSGYKHHILPAPAVYLIDTNGVVRFNYVNPDYKERISSDVLLAAARAYIK